MTDTNESSTDRNLDHDTIPGAHREMSPSQRARAVYTGKTPDEVPLFLDLSHWYKKNYDVPFDLTGLSRVDPRLVELHRRLNAVAYVEMGSFYDTYYDDPAITSQASTTNGVYRHEISTPIGAVFEERVFELVSYSYNITHRLIQSIEDFRVIQYAMEALRIRTRFDRYEAWRAAHGERAFVYVQLPYSGLGSLLSRNMGVEKSVYAIVDEPVAVRSFIDTINDANLRILDKIIGGPFDVLFQSDNLDGNVQTPDLFQTYSAEYYSEVAARAHSHGKYFAVHVDGEMRGLLSALAGCGVDCIDAATPAPMFSLTPEMARREAGPDMILSGGIPPTVFSRTSTDKAFEDSVRSWLELKRISSRLILAAGDQVPPDTDWERIARLPDLVREYGRYC